MIWTILLYSVQFSPFLFVAAIAIVVIGAATKSIMRGGDRYD